MNTTTQQTEPQLLIDDHHGIYVIQSFCKAYEAYITNMDEVREDFAICLQGPDHEDYLDAWADLVDNVKITDDNGGKFYVGNLGESGDLWAIPEGYEYPED